MNEHAANFVKRAQAAGLPQQRIAALLDKAYEIGSRGNVKTAAEANLNQIVASLLNEAGLDKTASSVSYTNGILKEALDQGATPQQAVGFAKEALRKTSADLSVMNKLATITKNPSYASYAEGFLKAAQEAGMSQTNAASTLVSLFEQEKRAGGADDLFKHTGVPGGDPGAGGPPPGADPSQDGGDPTGGAGPGGQIPPEILIQLLQMLAQQQQGGQQGGPPGMSPGGPPGMPPGGGAGGPPPGMPPGGAQ